MNKKKDIRAAVQQQTKQTQRALLSWYEANKRPLPWRLNQDPYRVWISEVMLQQTTVNAVIPFYNRFLENFKTVHELARAQESQVLQNWSGLGYYSRARNLHRAAKILSKSGFSKTAAELCELPGFGPYTSRAVSSICFEEKCGVLDGNVIRVLSRHFGLNVDWWKPKERIQLQELADQLAQVDRPSNWNQAMMELGASICSPQKPACPICPLRNSCVAFKENLAAKLPLKKPRKTKQIWVWRADLIKSKSKILFVTNDYAPFLKNQWLPPGKATLESTPPKNFLFKHSITHYEIYVILRKSKKLQAKLINKFTHKQWVARENISGVSPTSLVSKLISLSL